MEKNVWNVLFRRCFGVHCLYKLEFPKLTVFNFLLDIGPVHSADFGRWTMKNHLVICPLEWYHWGPGRISLVLTVMFNYVHQEDHFISIVMFEPPAVTNFRNCFAKVIYLSQVYNPNFSFWRKVIWKVSISNLEFKATICGLFIRY
jgi:hypothetical protein